VQSVPLRETGPGARNYLRRVSLRVAPGLEEQFGIEVADTSVASVDVERSSELITVVITGEAPGTTQIVARWLPDNEIAAVMGVDVLRKTTRTVSIANVAYLGGVFNTNFPGATDLEQYLNSVWGVQANLWFDVSSVGPHVVNYDINGNEKLDCGPSGLPITGEEDRILHSSACSLSYDINIAFVNDLNIDGLAAVMRLPGLVFVQQYVGLSNPLYVIAHELGHSAGVISPAHNNSSTQNLMYDTTLPHNPKEIRRQDWKQIAR
jgi:hypothetical protein